MTGQYIITGPDRPTTGTTLLTGHDSVCIAMISLHYNFIET